VPPRVLVADDHGLVRRALRLLLEEEGFDVVAEAADGQEAVRLSRELQPDLVVLDLIMPVLNGLDAAREIHRVSPRIGAVLLTMSQDDTPLLEALRDGVRGCVLKNGPPEDLVQALREVLKGGTYLSPGVSRAVVDAFRSPRGAARDPLSSRERQVLQLIAEGRKTREIADLLCISVKTAESHRARIMRKLAIRETAGLVRYAIHKGLTPP
jgi:two-component system, NarL family, response regulator NreC